MKRKIKVSRVLTLSKFIGGSHYIKETDDTKESDHFSFAESLSPLHIMIYQPGSENIPLGKKIKVTMEVM